MNPTKPHGFSINRPDCVQALINFGSERPAIRFKAETISYRQLGQRASQVAAYLELHHPDEQIIAVNTVRSIDTIASVLGILISGRAYLPLDPNYPTGRLQQIIEDSGVKSCLTPEDSSVYQEAGINIIDSLLCYRMPITDQTYTAKTSLAYILYTSGSTGKPKGVAMGHGPLVNLLQWQARESTADAETHTMQFAPLSFDVSFQEIFSTFSTGGTLILIEDDVRLDPFRLLAFIKEESVNRIFLPFVALQQLAETAGSSQSFPLCIREVMTAGEQLKVTPQLVNLFTGIPHAKLFNQYGPTEAHVVTQLILEGDATRWPALPTIGIPITNTSIFIINEQGGLVTDGAIGELLIGGDCLAEGYLNQPALTANKFITWQHPVQGALRVYRSGDLACYLPDGNINFLGRKDDQVKIRGHRVEPAEIEIILNGFPGIEQAVVVVRKDKSGQQKLLAFLKPAEQHVRVADIRKFAESNLPDYMIPSAFTLIESFPKTSSGKVDKKALPEIAIARPDLNTIYEPAESATEKKIAEIWAGLLQIDRVGVNDNFFELGGNSLLAVKTVVELRGKLGLELPVTRLYQSPTISAIANYLDEGDQPSETSAVSRAAAGHDVAVIGMSGRFPGASDINELWEALVHGRETTTFFADGELDVSIDDAVKNHPDYVKARGVIQDADMFDAGFFGINPKLAALMDPQQRVFLEIAWEVLESTGYLPSRYKGTIGVFAGAGNNTYFLNNILSNSDLVSQVGQFQVMTANEKDYVATRTAFQLNLKGPAISVNTGCSTSLLAIAQAVDNIRAGRCDLAIAGGVAVTAPIKSGQYYEEGAMFSKDGHCRPFDSASGGTVFSDGAGVVLLKDLERAIADGDMIYSVIKGVGVNNDGGNKSSFTAPSATGQATAIKQAIEDAGVDAADISYIEAHGTATPLGDPIEIEGLKLAFGKQPRQQYCAIGSVKSNMGHLTAAAGVVGLIKTVLSIYHKKLPASLHFTSPNPQIDFSKSPFYVNSSLREWTNEERTAGVSSFGVGGTNVHVILQSFEQPADVPTGIKPAYLIPMSAKSQTALDGYAAKLSAFIENGPRATLHNIADALIKTREQFNHRRFIVAGDAAELQHKLRTQPLPSEKSIVKSRVQKIAFVFAGQGSQFVNMGLDLYKYEPVFTQAVDECATLLNEFIGGDIRAVLYPKDSTEPEHDLNDTAFAQPAIFVIEYAIARLWMHWGVKPAVLIGHSIGEFVAAHLAGVFSLRDALKLIAARGRMMSALPAGRMLSVRSGAAALAHLLPSGISVAAINGKSVTVVAGTSEDIEALSEVLNAHGIANKPIHTSHAFHSKMMDPVEAPFKLLVQSVDRFAPKIPIISTVTGRGLSDAEAVDPSYWSHHLLNTVRFADAIDNLAKESSVLFLEVGPRNVVASLIKQHLGEHTVPVIASQQPAPSRHSAYNEIIHAAGELWLHDININLAEIIGDGTKTSVAPKVVLPSYAFDRKRYWVEPRNIVLNTDHRVADQRSTSNTNPITTPETPTQIINMRKNAIATQLRDILEEASGLEMKHVPGDASFIEIGLDSLLLTQVALTLKKQFPVPVTFRQLNEEVTTIEELAAYYDSRLPQEPAANVTAQANYVTNVPAHTQNASHGEPRHFIHQHTPQQINQQAVGNYEQQLQQGQHQSGYQQAQNYSPYNSQLQATLSNQPGSHQQQLYGYPQANQQLPYGYWQVNQQLPYGYPQANQPQPYGYPQLMGAPHQPINSYPAYGQAPGADYSALGMIAHQMDQLARQVAFMQNSQVNAAQTLQPDNVQHPLDPARNPGNGPNAASSTITPANSAACGSSVSKGPSAGSATNADITQDEAVELKKPFGATARIDKQTTELSATQKEFLHKLLSEYTHKTKLSKSYTQEHRAHMADPRVVSGFRPLTKEMVYPIVMNRSKGSRMWDLDGNEYIDLLNGFGSSFLGYQPEIIKHALHAQIEEGFEIGPQHHLAGPVCKLICEFTGADRAALCNTGSEAVLGAMRIARTVTGRSLIVAFSGSYHGIVDEVIVRGTKKLKSFPAAPGIMPEAVQNMLILDYGTDEALAIIRERAHELAAVLVEPVQSRRPEFQPVEFLKKVREITANSGTALIFDEVITGFRMHPGGAQALFGVKADLGTYGKVVGAGISIGVIAGTNHFMNALDGGHWQFGDASAPEAGVTYFAGTFVRHPLALAASKASLEYMKKMGPSLQQNITAKTEKLANGLNRIFESYGLPLYVANFGSLWKIKYKEEFPYSELLFTLMRNRGFHILDNFPCFLTEAHSDREIDQCLQAFADSVKDMIAGGFYKPTKSPADPSSQSTDTKDAVTHVNDGQPPVPGARLGKDSDGNPAWFISNPNQPGKYLQLNKK